MANGKYKEWLESEGLIKIEGWARDGLTEVQIAENIGISRSTLGEWKKKYQAISDTLKKGKEIVDRKVENALLKRALGYSYYEDKYICVPMDKDEYNQKLQEYINLYKISHPEATDDELMIARENFPKERQVLAERKVKEMPPDVTAQIFWVKNRKPEDWRDKKNLELSDTEAEKSKLDDIVQQMCGDG